MLIFASDYDRTLTDKNLEPCKGVISYISSFRPDIFFVIASGRRLEFLEENVGSYADAIVAENGAIIKINGRKITFGKDWNTKVRELIKEDERIWFGEVLLYSLISEEDRIKKALSEKISFRIERNKESIMVMPEYVSKGFGVSVVLKLLGVENERLASIGDDCNDLSMLEISKIKLAVQNSLPKLKAISNFVSDLPYCEGTLEAFNYLVQRLNVLNH